MFFSASVIAGGLGGYQWQPPDVMDSDSGLRIVVSSHDLAGERGIGVLKRNEDGQWAVEAQFGGVCRAAAAYGGEWYIFGEDSYSRYRDKTWARTEPRPFVWKVAAAIGGSELWVFGFDVKDKQFVVQAAVLREGNWIEIPDPPAFDSMCRQVCAARLGESLYVFWYTRGKGGQNGTVHYAAVTPDGWGETGQLQAVAADVLIAVSSGKSIALWQMNADKGLSEKNPVRYRVFDGDAWSEVEEFIVEDSTTNRTLYLAGASEHGEAALIMGSGRKVELATFSNDGGLDVEEVYSMPNALPVEVLLGYGLLFSSLCIVAAISMVRTGNRAIYIDIPAGRAEVASWRLRGAAMAFDLMMIVGLFLISRLACVQADDPSQDVLGFIQSMHFWSAAFFAVLELGTGQSMGKKLMGIAVVSVDGTPARAGQIIIRSIVRLIDSFLLAPVALIFMLNTPLGQRLGDLAAKTVVVRVVNIQRKEEQPRKPSDSSSN